MHETSTDGPAHKGALYLTNKILEIRLLCYRTRSKSALVARMHLSSVQPTVTSSDSESAPAWGAAGAGGRWQDEARNPRSVLLLSSHGDAASWAGRGGACSSWLGTAWAWPGHGQDNQNGPIVMVTGRQSRLFRRHPPLPCPRRAPRRVSPRPAPPRLAPAPPAPSARHASPTTTDQGDHRAAAFRVLIANERVHSQRRLIKHKNRSPTPANKPSKTNT